MNLLQEYFKPEFLNRIDETIIFDGLSKQDIRNIVDLQLQKVKQRLQQKDIVIEFTDAIKDMLAKQGYDPAFGARPLKRLIQSTILDQLALQIIKNKVKHQVKVDWNQRAVVFA